MFFVEECLLITGQNFYSNNCNNPVHTKIGDIKL